MSANTYSDEEIDEMNEFFYSVINLVVLWLKKIPEIMQKSFKEMKMEPDMPLIDEDAALVSCCCELMGLLHRFWCGCHRCLRYYIHYDRQPKSFANPIAKQYPEIDFIGRRIPPD